MCSYLEQTWKCMFANHDKGDVGRSKWRGPLIWLNFPNCPGVVDCKHVQIVQPNATGSLYHNYKHFFQLAYLFCWQFVMRTTASCTLTLGLGDVFGVSKHITRPYVWKRLDYLKRILNYRLSRARRYIECTFGIMANKWGIFHRPLNVSLELAERLF